jgi:SAM-dependent methyltransferase
MSFPWLDEILVCPSCGGDLTHLKSEYLCNVCAHDFPIRYGIPDFRLVPDPYISIPDELRKIESFYKPDASFQDLIAQYYRITPESPAALHQRYVATMAGAVARGAALVGKLQALYPTAERRRILDLGCGTGGMSVAATRLYDQVVGVDVALRWLLIGHRRLIVEDVQLPLICANAESLPFRSEAFDAVVADAVLEHVNDSARMRDESLRVLRPGGAFFFTTNNRFSILPEPHVRIAAFGLLPRPLMEPVARRMRRTPYRARLHSRRELRRIFRGFGEVVLPWYEPGELGPKRERIRRLWERFRRLAVVRATLGPVVPQYFIYGQRPTAAHPTTSFSPVTK